MYTKEVFCFFVLFFFCCCCCCHKTGSQLANSDKWLFECDFHDENQQFSWWKSTLGHSLISGWGDDIDCHGLINIDFTDRIIDVYQLTIPGLN